MSHPKGYAELHRHLDGSLRLSTLQELADRFGTQLPGSSKDLLFYQGMGLHGALERFAITLSVLQFPDEVKRIASEMCEDAQKEGTSTLEIRFAPHLHEGASIEDIVDAAVEGVDGRAGLLLCGLYGDPPERLKRYAELAKDRPSVVGIDIAGGPSSGHDWKLEDYQEAFTLARDLGIGRTVHAGEGRPPEEIRTAIEVLHAQRIGHGTTLLQAPEIADLVMERGVTIEACVTSNMQVGAIPSIQAHDLPKWLKMGLKACICTDNTLFSDVDAIQEHQRVATIPGMTDELIQKAIQYGHDAAFTR